MSAPAVQLGALVMCNHGGIANPAAPYPRVFLSGQPMVTITSSYVVAGCSLSGSAPHCVTGQWLTGSVRVVAGGAPVVIMSGASVCVASGTPMLAMSAQQRVLMT